MAKLQAPVAELGGSAVDFALKGVDGQIWSLERCAQEKGLLVMFICNHCPYVKAILERLVEDVAELSTIGVGSVAIMSNDVNEYPEDSYEQMQRVSETYDFPFPYLIDTSQQIAKAYGAVCTPDFFGFNGFMRLQYRGRLDDGGARELLEPRNRELFKAMKQIANTNLGPEQQFPSVGCSIKWK